VAELGNLSAGILLSLERMSTVKIRAGSLFRTPTARIGLPKRLSRPAGWVFLRPPQASTFLHRMYTGRQGFRLARNTLSGAKSKEENFV